MTLYTGRDAKHRNQRRGKKPASPVTGTISVVEERNGQAKTP
jgi:hypothetical protein